MANPKPLPVEFQDRRHFLPMVPLPVEENWTCKRSGDCCTRPSEVVMTKEEAKLLIFHAPTGIKLDFRPVEGNFVAMKAGPCPLFVFHGCVVYKHRPYNCRRFACMRPDPKTEPWVFTREGDCANLWVRLKQSRMARRMAVLFQRRAQRWAVAHGWPQSNGETDG